MTSETLDDMLKRAAAADGWMRVVHRCAWCGRTVDAYGNYSTVVSLDPAAVITDGMCAACGTRALAQLGARRARAA